MKVSVEISLYPLQDNYVDSILEFIKDLNSYEGITVNTNTMSTQVFGEYRDVMQALTESMERSFEEEATRLLVVKFANADLSPQP